MLFKTLCCTSGLVISWSEDAAYGSETCNPHNVKYRLKILQLTEKGICRYWKFKIEILI